ncbi:hypothetical protein AB0C93_17530 [Streptomyces sp. NPDC048518]|uniref:hypothetical protein n=1 Tax=Streptomyces sp. NPDC048518 TaxID=3155029 RepID=UPI0033CF2A5F
MKRMTTAVLCAVIGAAALAACATDDGPSTSSDSAASGNPEPVAGPPSPEAGQQEILLHDLEAIDPRLVADEGRAVDDAGWVCLDVRQGAVEDEVRHDAARRFDVTNDQADLVVRSIKTTFCGGG